MTLRTRSSGGLRNEAEYPRRFRQGPCLRSQQRRSRRPRGPAGHPGPRVSAHGEGRQQRRRKEAANILECRGSSPRNYQNALVFLAADATRLEELDQAVRQYIAWDSIWDERETLNLDQFQTKQAETKRKNADETVDARIPETFQWLIVPGQSDPKGEHRVDGDSAPGPGSLGCHGRRRS